MIPRLTFSSLTPIFHELIKRHQAGKLSFKNVVVFNAYEYFPLSEENVNRGINQLKERFLNHIDIEAENIFTPDGTIAQNDVQGPDGIAKIKIVSIERK